MEKRGLRKRGGVGGREGGTGPAVAVLWSAVLACGCGARTGLPVSLDGGCVNESMEVPAAAPWTDTGIDVIPGQRLRITATGMARYGGDPRQVTDANGGTYYGKRFFTTAVLPNAVVVSLIGKVGGSTAVGTGTALPEGAPDDGAGFVGTSYDEVVLEGGRLFLGFNDQAFAFADNSGAFTVTITLC